MRPALILAAVVALTGVSPALAQDDAGGQYAAALQRMIAATAGGTCPEDVMAEGLLTACRQQLPQMQAGLSSLGAVETVTFVGAEDTPQGRIERYTVRFAGGQSLNWGIGGESGGKFAVAFAGG